MTTQNRQIDKDWLDIKTDLSLADGTQYLFQILGGANGFEVYEGSQPDEATRGVFTPLNEKVYVKPSSGVDVWVRCSNSNALLIVTEAV